MDPMLSVTMLSLQTLNNDQLTAANNAINDFGRMPPENLAYNKMISLAPIDQTGRPRADCLPNALAREVNRRVAAGIFS